MMMKAFFLLFVLALSTLLTGCGGGKRSDDDIANDYKAKLKAIEAQERVELAKAEYAFKVKQIELADQAKADERSSQAFSALMKLAILLGAAAGAWALHLRHKTRALVEATTQKKVDALVSMLPQLPEAERKALCALLLSAQTPAPRGLRWRAP